MSILILCNDEEVWFPASGVAWLFLDQIRSLERLAGHPSGVSEVISDEITIDGPASAAFVAVVVQELETTNHRWLFRLAAGCTEVAMALNHKITGAWPTVSDTLQPLLNNAHGLRVRLG